MKKLPLVPIVTFLVLSTVFTGISFFIGDKIKESSRETFQSRVNVETKNFTSHLKNLLNGYEGVIISARSFINSSDFVSREEWQKYIQGLDLDNNYKSISAFGFISRVKSEDREEYIELIQEESQYQGFQIMPTTDNSESYVVQYIEPHEENQEALGFDLYSDDVRRKAMELARDENKIVITKPLALIQDNIDVRSFLMLLPIYEETARINSIEQRREAITGFVSVVVRADDLFSEILSYIKLNINSGFIVEDSTDEEISFLSSKSSKGEQFNLDNQEFVLSLSERLLIGSREWRISFYGDEKNVEVIGFEKYIPTIIFGLGLFISLLVGFYLYESALVTKKAEALAEELTEDLKKFKLAIENVSEQIVITDDEGIVVYANPITEVITGYKYSELLGMKAGKLWGGLMSKDFYKNMWQTIKIEKKIYSGEIKNRRKNGDQYQVQLKISPILDKNDKVVFFVAIERDISRERQLIAMKSQFVSLASHQLRTPLSSMRWYLEMIISGENGKLNEKQAEILDSVYKSNLKMVSLVNGLLNISRLESGRFIFDPKETSVVELVNDVVGDLATISKKAKVKINIEFSDDLEKIFIDQQMIREVYKIILSNAIKYSKENSQVFIKLTREKDNLVTQIKDSGIGIPDSDKINIFRKFYRSSNSATSAGEGSGLGLHLAKLIIESTNGKIWFESAKGKGTTFWFSLPYSNDEAISLEELKKQEIKNIN